METVILFRKDFSTEEEMKIASKYFEVKESRVLCNKENVIGRYSVLPFYAETENDLALNDCKLVNSNSQHKWIADFDWYFDLQDLTPTTWFDNNFHESKHEGPFVVKGRTNSRKNQWNKLMYAETRKDASRVACELSGDPFIGPQGLIYREYIPLKTFEIGINDLPFANEWRFFFYKDRLVNYGFYWSTIDDLSQVEITEEGIEFAKKCASRACDHCEFYVLDIAEKAQGGWILIEINDGQMSGLSECNPDDLYKNLKECCNYFQ